jgi:hypothetical protein
MEIDSEYKKSDKRRESEKRVWVAGREGGGGARLWTAVVTAGRATECWGGNSDGERRP